MPTPHTPILSVLRAEESRLSAQLAALTALIAYYAPRKQSKSVRIRLAHAQVLRENPHITGRWAMEMTAERVGCSVEDVAKVVAATKGTQ